jgi:hypothetical protein
MKKRMSLRHQGSPVLWEGLNVFVLAIAGKILAVQWHFEKHYQLETKRFIVQKLKGAQAFAARL